MFKVGVRFTGATKSVWADGYERVEVTPTSVIAFESETEFTIFPYANAHFIDVKEEEAQ